MNEQKNITTHGGTAADAAHYQTLTQQPIEIMQRLMTREQFLGFLHGNVVKYALRCGHKDDPVKDMEKARQYADWYVRAAKGETIDPRVENKGEEETLCAEGGAKADCYLCWHRIAKMLEQRQDETTRGGE